MRPSLIHSNNGLRSASAPIPTVSFASKNASTDGPTGVLARAMAAAAAMASSSPPADSSRRNAAIKLRISTAPNVVLAHYEPHTEERIVRPRVCTPERGPSLRVRTSPAFPPPWAPPLPVAGDSVSSAHDCARECHRAVQGGARRGARGRHGVDRRQEPLAAAGRRGPARPTRRGCSRPTSTTCAAAARPVSPRPCWTA